MREQQVIECVERWLEVKGYRIAKGKPKRASLGNIDVRAYKPKGQQWFIEAKGDNKNIRISFLVALGQIITRAERIINPASRYGIAVPDSEKWRRLMRQVPIWIRKVLRLHIIFVGKNCEITVFPPAKEI